MKEDETLGAYLKRIREEKQLSIEDVSVALNFKKEHIDSIESDTILNFLPSAYARGFIRNYTEYLGLDYHEIIDKFDVLYKSETPKIYVEDIGPLVALEHRPRHRKGIFTYIIFIILAGAIFTAVYVYQKFYYGGQKKLFPFNSKEGQTTDNSDETKHNGDKTVSKVDTKLVLKVKFIKNARITPTIDGTRIPGKFYGADTVEEFPAQTALVLEIDEAANVEVFHKDVKQDIGKGKVQLFLDEKGLRIEPKTEPEVEPISE